MWYVYILRSRNFANQEYIGCSSDLRRRVVDHNAGRSRHTSKFAPWDLVFYAALRDKGTGLAFESYLKSHSGRSFSKKRLLPADTSRNANGPG